MRATDAGMNGADAQKFPVTFSFANVVSIMRPPKPPNPPVPPDLLADLLALRPYIEHILCDGSRDPHVRAAAKDSVQTVLRKAVQHLRAYEPHEDGLRPWVTRIARNEKIDVFRSDQRRDDTFGHSQIASDFAPGSCPSPEHEAQVRALLERVFAVIEEMPPEMQDVLTLVVLSEDSHEAIAEQLGITKGAAKMRLSRARKMLRKRAGSIRDHIGAWLVLITRKLTAPRHTLPTRVLTFFWQAGHLLPPLIIGFVALPELEPTLAMPTETGVVAPTRSEPSLCVLDERRPVVERASRVIAPDQPTSANGHASDKPRQRTPSRRAFDVVLPPPTPS